MNTRKKPVAGGGRVLSLHHLKLGVTPANHMRGKRADLFKRAHLMPTPFMQARSPVQFRALVISGAVLVAVEMGPRNHRHDPN